VDVRVDRSDLRHGIFRAGQVLPRLRGGLMDWIPKWGWITASVFIFMFFAAVIAEIIVEGAKTCG
jgi:hypothetical protein